MLSSLQVNLPIDRILLVRIALTLSAIVSAASPTLGQTQSRTATIEDCIVSLHSQALVPAQQAGVLVSLAVREGAMVSAGQIVGQIDASQQILKHNLSDIERQAAAEKAAEDIDIRFSKASAAVAETEYQQSLEANSRHSNTIPQPEIRRLKLAAHKTLLQIEKAISDRHVAELILATREAEVKLTASEIEKCQITSPLEGEIVELLRRPGEWVNPGEAIVRVIHLDVLRVEGFLNTASHHPRSVDGALVEVTVSLAGKQTELFQGRIVFVSPIVQGGGQYRVWAEVENRQIGKHWVMQPGMTAQMTIKLN